MDVLNLYAGLGGNRKLWTDCDVTAIEIDESIAAIYKKNFPNDNVIVTDAHQYLLNHYNENWGFIWSSPPYPSHSRARFWNRKLAAIYPDMSLYQEIIFLKSFFKKEWVVENVVSYYEPLMKPQKINRHFFIHDFKDESLKPTEGNIKMWQHITGFDIDNIKLKQRKDKILRNCVLPELGKHIFDCAVGVKIKSKQLTLF